MIYENEFGVFGMLFVFVMFDSQVEVQCVVEWLNQVGIILECIWQVVGGSDIVFCMDVVEDCNKGFWDSFEDFFFFDEDWYFYIEGLLCGGYLVIVIGLFGVDYEIVLDIFDDEGSINFEECEESWCLEGWSDYQFSSYVLGSMVFVYGVCVGVMGDLDRFYVDEDSMGVDVFLW